MTTFSRSAVTFFVFILTIGFGSFGCGSVDQLPLPGVQGAEYAAPEADDGCGVPKNEEVLVAEIVRLVNEERAARDLPPVTLEPKLTAAAEGYACTLASEGYFAHYHPETGEGPGDRARAVDYRFLFVGENLAAGHETPAQAMEGWMTSEEGHRENILSPMWVHIGVAVRQGGPYGVYWVQEFGAPVEMSDSEEIAAAR